MSKLGTKNKPARVRVQTEERAIEIMAICNQKNLQVIVGIEPGKTEDVSDFDKLMNSSVSKTVSTLISRNAPCPCGSGKQYKRCCGK
jgi:SWIM/SEC-C metal-binding protein